ncbi:hypothetical protein TRVA0_012S02366 [Trichomonascus vanleenenianus]|uniref:uncharacterized protein n=1 Tax=Trichomonascus vanleenenianus TaxID=2268995 RepID=UPI003ECAA37A
MPGRKFYVYLKNNSAIHDRIVIKTLVEKRAGRVLRVEPELVVEIDDATSRAILKMDCVTDIRRIAPGFY